MILSVAKLVLNGSFGGFYLDKEMSDWLVENKNWKVSENWQCNDTDADIIRLEENYYYANSVKHKDEELFRANLDLVECVEYFKEKYKDIKDSMSYGEYRDWRKDHKCMDLGVEEAFMSVSISDYDGKEKLVIS